MENKSTGVAYLLWFLLGFVGAHRFYLGDNKSGVWMVILFIVFLILPFKLFSGLILLAWWLIDGLRIDNWIKRLKAGMPLWD